MNSQKKPGQTSSTNEWNMSKSAPWMWRKEGNWLQLNGIKTHAAYTLYTLPEIADLDHVRSTTIIKDCHLMYHARISEIHSESLESFQKRARSLPSISKRFPKIHQFQKLSIQPTQRDFELTRIPNQVVQSCPGVHFGEQSGQPVAWRIPWPPKLRPMA